VADLFHRLIRRIRGEERLFTTPRAPFQEPDHAVGEILSWRGRLYRVTRWEEGTTVTLERGGTTRTWNVWGNPLSDGEVQGELEAAARAILDGASEKASDSAEEGHSARRGNDDADAATPQG
jgi:hypothetical protein